MIYQKVSFQKLFRLARPTLFCLLSLTVLAGCAAKVEEPVAPVVMVPPAATLAKPEIKPATVVVEASHVTLTSPYGPRKLGKKSRMHKGVDLKAPKGCAILAHDAGEVTVAGQRRGYGLSVDVKHSNGLVTRYAHMSQVAVKVGDRVGRGDALGAIGRTGRASTNHLHFEVLKNGQAVNPMPYLEQGFAQLISPDSLSRVRTAEASSASQSKTSKR
jgi:Membrane proteins related to metalloendopeptidases